jgi:hypothetical protein
MTNQLLGSVGTTEYHNYCTSPVALAVTTPVPLLLGVSVPEIPTNQNVLKAPNVALHHYKGRYEELPNTFVVAGSPYGNQWLSETTANVETEAVRLLNVMKALHPTGTILFLGSLLQLLLLWFILK